MKALCVQILIMLLITGIAVANMKFESQTNIESGSMTIISDSTQTSEVTSGYGQISHSETYTREDGNETKNVRFSLRSDNGHEDLGTHIIEAKSKDNPTRVFNWMSNIYKVDSVAEISSNDGSLATNYQTNGLTGRQWFNYRYFEDYWRSKASFTGWQEGVNITDAKSIEFNWTQAKNTTNSDWLPCTACESNTGEVKQPVSYAATGVAYAGKGVAYAARNVNSTGLQGNGSTA